LRAIRKVITSVCRGSQKAALFVARDTGVRLHMPLHISTEDAKKRVLVYRPSHILYHSDLNRDASVVRLNREALQVFSDSITIGQRHALAAEAEAAQKWIGQGGHESGLPMPAGRVGWKGLSYINYEHMKIGSAFELHLKSRLLARNYVLHKIDGRIPEYKSLPKQQKTRPIEKHELFAIQAYHFDGTQNYLPGLLDGSLNFEWLTKNPKYRAALELTDQQLDIIDDYRLLRNQMHFPGDFLETPHIRAFARPIIDFLTAFINVELVDWSNRLIAQHRLVFPQIARLN
jgi:hypothetical protein